MVEKERIWILLGKRQCGEASDAELKELNALLKEDESVRLSEDIIDKLWKVPLKTTDTPQKHLDWSELEAKIKKAEKKRSLKKWWWSAAAVMALLTATVAFLFIQKEKNSFARSEKKTALQWNNITTPVNARSKIELPDGSKVWINEDSHLTYDSKNFGIHNREVRLQGEAYFEVKKNAEFPFIVHLPKVDIQVLGTAFNVKTYPKDKNIEVALIRGKVAVSLLDRPEKKVILKPDERMIIPKRLSAIREVSPPAMYKVVKIEKDEAGLARATSWTRKELVFDNETFEQIAIQMESWYRLKIRFENDTLKKLHFSGVIKDETITDALRAMQLSRPFHFQIRDGIVWIEK